ncbi:MAG TPA: MFS transporter [Blastocatellia bacterium]|nr:MFS transporter [Blastocatellia bacterium]
MATRRKAIVIHNREQKSTGQAASAGLLLIGLAYLGFISLGLPDGLHGIAWPSVRATFQLGIDALGAILVMFTSGYLLASFSSSRLLTVMNVGTLLALSCLLMAISLTGYALAPSWGCMVALAPVAGAGSGAIDAGLNSYAALNFSRRTVNWLHACYGIGAAIGPAIMTAVLNAGRPWRWGYAIVAMTQFVMAVAFALTRARWTNIDAKAQAVGKLPRQSNRGTLRLPAVWLSIAIFFIYTGLETAAGAWAFSFFTEGRGVGAGEAGLWVSVYWGSLTVGRLIFGFVAESRAARWLLRLCLVSIGVGAALIWLNAAPLLSFCGLALMGLASGPVFPSMIAETPRRLGAAHTANAVGYEIAAAMLGASLLPAAIGIAASRFGLESIGPALLLTAILLFVFHESLRFAGQSAIRGESSST